MPGAGCPRARSYHSAVRRLALTAAGTVFVGLGFLGAVLPVLPTTPFLLLAAWCFARSNPELGRRLLEHRLFRPYRPFLDGSKPVPARVRWITVGIVWAAVSLSAWLLYSRDALPWWLAALIGAAALTGTIVILRFRRVKKAQIELPDDEVPGHDA